jgi:hypothetical protein
MLNRPLEHLHDPILPIPPPIRAHNANAIRDPLQRPALTPSQVRNRHEPALAREVIRLRDGAPVNVALLLRRGPHRAQDPHHTVRGRPAERPRSLPRERACGRRVARYDDVHHARAVWLWERAGGQAGWRLHPRLDAIVWLIEMCWVHLCCAVLLLSFFRSCFFFFFLSINSSARFLSQIKLFGPGSVTKKGNGGCSGMR